MLSIYFCTGGLGDEFRTCNNAFFCFELFFEALEVRDDALFVDWSVEALACTEVLVDGLVSRAQRQK